MSSAITKKAPPKVRDRDVQKALEELYGHLNALTDSVKHAQAGKSSETEGTPGDLRVVKRGNGDYGIEARHKDEWIESALGTFKQRKGGGHYSSLQKVNASPGTYANATVEVDEKGRAVSVTAGSAPVLPTRTLTISGTAARITTSPVGAQDLSADRAWMVDIDAAYVGQISIVTLGNVTTGAWQATKVGLAYGGTNADLSATGGVGQYLKQVSSGAAITVGTIPAADIASAATLAVDSSLIISAGSGVGAVLSALTLQRAALTGDITASQGSNATTLATVNSNVGSFGSATQTGTFTVNGKGLITAASNVTVAPAASSITGAGNLTVGTSLSITSGTGTGATLVSLGLNTIQDIRTTDSPTFANINLSGYIGSIIDAQISFTVSGVTIDGQGGGAGLYFSGLADISANSLLSINPFNQVQSIANAAIGKIFISQGTTDFPIWSTDIATGVTIGSAYIYRVGGTKVGLADGGTDADLSATGGAGKYLKQSSSGAAITVGTIPASDIASGANLTVGSSLSITSGSGTAATLIALGLNTIQGIRTADSPQFTGLLLGTSTSINTITAVNGSDFAIYNTTPDATNYERLRFYWSGNQAFIAQEAGGTGSNRSLVLSSGTGNNSTITLTRGSAPFFAWTRANAFTETGNHAQFATKGSAASGTQVGFAVNPTWSQSSTAAATDFLVNRTETSVGSGSQLLCDLQVGSVSKFKVDNTGDTTLIGTTARTIAMARHTTSNTAGNSLTIQSAGATSGATDKAGGDLIASPGINTGTGVSGLIRLKGYTVATGTATTDNTQLDSSIVNCFKALANNTVTALVNCTIANGSTTSGIISYSVEVTNGTDYQIEEGKVSYHVTNKAGTLANNTTVKFGNQQAMTTGTLTVSFTITAANPAVLSVNANSSLTPSAGYPRIKYKIDNLNHQAIAVQ